MGDVQRTFGYSVPLIDLSKNNASGSNHTASYTDLTKSDDLSSNHRSVDIIDLTDDDKRHNISDIPVIDLTSDDEDLLNYRIPVINLTGKDEDILNYRIPIIDLTDDDVQDISNQTQYIGDDASSSKDTTRNFDIGETDCRVTKRSTKRTDLTFDDIQDFISNTSVTDLTLNNDQFNNLRIRHTYTTNDVQDIADQLQNFDITDGKQKNRNYCIPTNDLKNHSSDRIISFPDYVTTGFDMPREKINNNDRRHIIDSIQNDGRVITKLVEDAEMHDLSCNISHNGFQSSLGENNFKIPAANFSNITNENGFLNYYETSNTNEMPTDTYSSMQKFQGRKENFANHPPKHFECRKETNFTNHSVKNFDCSKKPSLINHSLKNFACRKEKFLTDNLSKNYEENIEMNSTNHPLRNNFEEDRNETIWTNPLVTNNSEKKSSRRRRSEEIFRSNAADFMEPARYPIPLRHSLGRSTVNSSKNVPIECAENYEDGSSILTVSSIMRRRKSKLSTDISERIIQKGTRSKEQSTTRENTFFFEILKRIFLKCWIVLLFTFIGLYLCL